MRIWSLHPQYLDAKGLVALWRETLLAKKVLEGKTKGYKNHSQLLRFKASKHADKLINKYLEEVYKEALARGYNFDKSKFVLVSEKVYLSVTKGQLDYEFSHLMKKLAKRAPQKYLEIAALKIIKSNPIFKPVEGETEKWEKI
jgi:hypothetical protein